MHTYQQVAEKEISLAASEYQHQEWFQLGRLEQMYPVYEMDRIVRTKIKELPSLPEFLTAAHIPEFPTQLQELMGCMNPTSYGPTDPHLWLVRKIPPQTWENCRDTSERKSRTHFYDDLVDLLIELATKRGNDSHMDKYLRKLLQRRPLLRQFLDGGSPPPHSDPGKGRGGQLKHMKKTPPCNCKGALNLLYCRPMDNKGGPFLLACLLAPTTAQAET